MGDDDHKSESKRRLGRPTKFTPENCKKILEAVALGAPATLAPMSAGVDYNTYRGWINKGEREKTGPYSDFAEAVQKAEGDAVKRWLAIIEKAAQANNWTAAAWKLERRYPQDFALARQRADIAAMSDEELNAKIADYIGKVGIAAFARGEGKAPREAGGASAQSG